MISISLMHFEIKFCGQMAVKADLCSVPELQECHTFFTTITDFCCCDYCTIVFDTQAYHRIESKWFEFCHSKSIVFVLASVRFGELRKSQCSV